ncbi:hypothetical protein GCM10027271_05270 [Saccharopolyspora gloriosae]
MSSSIGSKSATATSAGSAKSMRVFGATTVTRLNTVVPVATEAPYFLGPCIWVLLRLDPAKCGFSRRKRPARPKSAPSMAAPTTRE